MEMDRVRVKKTLQYGKNQYICIQPYFVETQFVGFNSYKTSTSKYIAIHQWSHRLLVQIHRIFDDVEERGGGGRMR